MVLEIKLDFNLPSAFIICFIFDLLCLDLSAFLSISSFIQAIILITCLHQQNYIAEELSKRVYSIACIPLYVPISALWFVIVALPGHINLFRFCSVCWVDDNALKTIFNF